MPTEYGDSNRKKAALRKLIEDDLAEVERNELNRLIKAAPKLLSACQMMDKCHGTTEWAMEQLSLPERDAIRAIRSAITEATSHNEQVKQ